jgi:hypothetical protein
MKIRVQDEPVREEVLHRMVVNYLRLTYPNVIFFSDLSGVFVSKAVAGKIKDLKCARGIPDIIILEPKIGHQVTDPSVTPVTPKMVSYHGLCIELKTVKNNPFRKDGSLKKDEHVTEQAEMLQRLSDKCYKALFCVGLEHTLREIDTYLSPAI